jgi:hypothetical protein
MPTPSARLVHGNLPEDITLLDEPDMLVQSLTVTPAREKSEYKGANRCVQGIEYLNPTLSFQFEAYVSDRTGLCDQHPGTAVADLANFAAARFGFDPTDGIMVFEDPSSVQNLQNPETINFTVVHYPFVSAA